MARNKEYGRRPVPSHPGGSSSIHRGGRGGYPSSSSPSSSSSSPSGPASNPFAVENYLEEVIEMNGCSIGLDKKTVEDISVAFAPNKSTAVSLSLADNIQQWDLDIYRSMVYGLQKDQLVNCLEDDPDLIEVEIETRKQRQNLSKTRGKEADRKEAHQIQKEKKLKEDEMKEKRKKEERTNKEDKEQDKAKDKEKEKEKEKRRERVDGSNNMEVEEDINPRTITTAVINEETTPGIDNLKTPEAGTEEYSDKRLQILSKGITSLEEQVIQYHFLSSLTPHTIPTFVEAMSFPENLVNLILQYPIDKRILVPLFQISSPLLVDAMKGHPLFCSSSLIVKSNSKGHVVTGTNANEDGEKTTVLEEEQKTIEIEKGDAKGEVNSRRVRGGRAGNRGRGRGGRGNQRGGRKGCASDGKQSPQSSTIANANESNKIVKPTRSINNCKNAKEKEKENERAKSKGVNQNGLGSGVTFVRSDVEHPVILTIKHIHDQATLLVGKAIQLRTKSALLIAIKFLITTLLMPNELHSVFQQTQASATTNLHSTTTTTTTTTTIEKEEKEEKNKEEHDGTNSVCASAQMGGNGNGNGNNSNNSFLMMGENSVPYLWIGPQLSILFSQPGASYNKINKEIEEFSILQQKILSLYGENYDGNIEKERNTSEQNNSSTCDKNGTASSSIDEGPLPVGHIPHGDIQFVKTLEAWTVEVETEKNKEKDKGRGGNCGQKKRSNKTNFPNDSNSVSSEKGENNDNDNQERPNLNESIYSTSSSGGESMYHRRKRAKREQKDTDFIGNDNGEDTDTSTIEVKEDDLSEDMGKDQFSSESEEHMEENVLNHLLDVVTQEQEEGMGEESVAILQEKLIDSSGGADIGLNNSKVDEENGSCSIEKKEENEDTWSKKLKPSYLRSILPLTTPFERVSGGASVSSHKTNLTDQISDLRIEWIPDQLMEGDNNSNRMDGEMRNSNSFANDKREKFMQARKNEILLDGYVRVDVIVCLLLTFLEDNLDMNINSNSLFNANDNANTSAYANYNDQTTKKKQRHGQQRQQQVLLLSII